jgi:hypothetical protein
MEVLDDDTIESPLFEKPKFKHILGELNLSIEGAKDIRDMATFENPSVRRALIIVQKFLKDKKRICYGGMAINAHLPKSLQFYDFSKNLPDYDFFTPDPEKDVKDLINLFKKDNLPEIDAKLGIHKGTTKIYVAFTPVADITEVSCPFYSKLSKHSFVKDRIHYADVNFLRMAMYLELSRPMGEVERWDKVYKRLYLLNHSVPPIPCKNTKMKNITHKEYNILLKYITDNALIYASPSLESLYKNVSTSISQTPVIAYSSNTIHDVKELLKKLGPSYTVYKWEPKDEFIPFLLGILNNNKIVALFVEQSACHSYNTIVMQNKSENINNNLHIATLDTLITLYYSLGYVKGLEEFGNFTCLANTLTNISNKIRNGDIKSEFPLFSIECSGHQPSKESLLRAKKIRIQEFNKTRKISNASKSGSSGKSRNIRH